MNIEREGYYVEHNGDCWQSVFPTSYAKLSQLHTDIDDALEYMVHECGIPQEMITVKGEPLA